MFVDVNVKIPVLPVIVISSGCADQKKNSDSKAVEMIAMMCMVPRYQSRSARWVCVVTI